RAATDAEELGDRQLDLAEAFLLVGRPAVEVDQVLHRALAEGGLADDQAAAVVLDRASEDFRRRRRATVDQHRQRAIPCNAAVAVAFHADPATGLAHLHHRALVDEQAGQLDRLGQRAAAVVAQVEYHAIDILGLQLAQQLADVAGGRGVVVAVEAAAFEILVEARQLDHPDALVGRVGLAGNGQHLGLGGLVLEPDLVAGDHHAGRLAVQTGAGRDHVQPHLRALRPADLLDHVVQAPADHVDHRPALALADRGDAI